VERKYLEIDKVIEYIKQHIYEPITLTELARYAAYSPYHFIRIFKERIGVPPQYYVSTLRLQHAKDLLIHTNLSVRDISLEVGQSSLGTFTTRFTERVGMTPSEFRNSPVMSEHYLHSLQQFNNWEVSINKRSQNAKLEGNIKAEIPFDGIVLIGLFPKPIPEGLPLYGTLLRKLGDFCFTDVKPGSYYLMATSVSWGSQTVDFILPHSTLRTRAKDPIVIESDKPVPFQKVMLYTPRLDDPPILISLPLLMGRFLNRVT